MSVIYSEIQLFDGEQSIYSLGDDGNIHLLAKAPLTSLPKVIVEQCYDHDVYQVKLYSSFIDMCSRVQKQITEYENTRFSANKIIVEVN